MEGLVGEENVSPDVKDADGNTLLLLAAQQVRSGFHPRAMMTTRNVR